MDTLEKRACALDPNSPGRRDRMLNRLVNFTRTSGMAIIFAAMLTVSALAEGGDGAAKTIGDAVANGMHKAYGLMTSIVMPIAALVFAVLALKMLLGSQKSVEEGQKGLIKVLIVIALVFTAPIIISEVAGWFSSMAADKGAFTVKDFSQSG